MQDVVYKGDELYAGQGLSGHDYRTWRGKGKRREKERKRETEREKGKERTENREQRHGDSRLLTVSQVDE